jgi:hypothetical protein
MWSPIISIREPGVTQYRVAQQGKTITFREVIERWKNDDAFARFFNALLKQSPYAAYFWEVKPVSRAELDEAFEFVLVDSTALARINADPSAFSEHFTGDRSVKSFSNLGGDSRLIVPTPLGPDESYGHLATFVRHAPEEQAVAFWKLVGEEFGRSICDRPKWLSTSGLGVYWVHVRIDPRPKYYSYGPYRIGE